MILITDLDHTLAKSAWRDHLRGDWDAYHTASAEDHPNQTMVDFINAISVSMTVICVTNRPERWRQLTMQWLLKHRIGIDDLIMRPNDDFRPSPELKLDVISQFKAQHPIMIDDREDIINAYVAAGYTALQVRS